MITSTEETLRFINPMPRKSILLFVFSVFFSACGPPSTESLLTGGEDIKNRIQTPAGYSRVSAKDGWQSYLQDFRLLPSDAPVLDYNGIPIPIQNHHVAVLDIDVGTKDLQQCADAIIRLRAEYLWQEGLKDIISFHFTSGHEFKWEDYRQGIRPIVQGNRVGFASKTSFMDDYATFRNYLDVIFMYAGTISLHREMNRVDRNSDYEIGDVIVQPGSPGHAVIIVDKAKHANGKTIYLLAQGYTPAQSIHIVKSGHEGISPWFNIPKTGPFIHQRFYLSDLGVRRF
jgi:hypothetical protein